MLGDPGEHRVRALGRLDRQNAARRRRPRPARRRSPTAPRAAARRARCRPRPPRGARRAPSEPPGATSRGATSCAPTMRTPSRSKIAARPTSSPLSPRRNSCASSAARLTAPQSSLRSANSGRVIAPTITISPMARSFSAANSLPISPIRTQTCGIGLDRSVGRADDADQERLTPGPARLGGDLERKRARAAENGQRRRAAAPGAPASGPFTPPRPCRRRGTQIARSPPSRRKATICCTAG